MKKVLILTCSTGEGHNSAAFAVCSALDKKGIEYEVKDPVSFQSERMKRMVSSVYNDTIRKAPAVFGAVYKLGDLYASSKLPSPVYYANARYAEALREYLYENHFDAVICTHLYGMEAVTALRKQPDFTIPCFGVVTDYVAIPFLGETNLTRMFVPTSEVREQLLEAGMEEEQLVLSGIPVHLKFAEHMDRCNARRTLDLPLNKRIYLIMTGGVGCENMKKLCDRLYESMDNRDIMVVLTGKNEELRKKLDSAYPLDPRMRTVSFTDQVQNYMAAADVLLSKPGGLSSTEAAVANVPLVHIHAIPGCETYNVKYFSSHGMSLGAETDAEAVDCARSLACDPAKAEQMCWMQRKFVNPHAADMIAEEVMKYVCK